MPDLEEKIASAAGGTNSPQCQLEAVIVRDKQRY